MNNEDQRVGPSMSNNVLMDELDRLHSENIYIFAYDRDDECAATIERLRLVISEVITRTRELIESGVLDENEDDFTNIDTLNELFDEMMPDRQPRDAAYQASMIARTLYKDTECGVTFCLIEGGCRVMGYAEGSDAHLPNHDLPWGTFSMPTFEAAVKLADEEGCKECDEVATLLNPNWE